MTTLPFASFFAAAAATVSFATPTTTTAPMVAANFAARICQAQSGDVAQQAVPLPVWKPGAPTGFLPLKAFAVRVDKIAPSAAGDTLEIFCTFKNQMPGVEQINGSSISGVVTDADGVGVSTDGFYSATGVPTVVAGNQSVEPNGSLSVRLLLRVPKGVAPFKTLTLWETSSLPQSVDISTAKWASAKPTANLVPLNLQYGKSEFSPCGKILDVRFDGFRKARDGAYEAFFTLKNTSEETLRTDMLDMTVSAPEVYLHSASGTKARLYDWARANGGETAIAITHHLAIPAGQSARVRYRTGAKPTFVPVKVSVSDAPSQTTVAWALTPPTPLKTTAKTK